MLLANVEAEYTDAETWPRHYLQSLVFFCKIRESNQQQQTPTPTDTHTHNINWKHYLFDTIQPYQLQPISTQ